MNLLEATGITTVNGSGFGQKEGTAHLRIAFLPPKELLESILSAVRAHVRESPEADDMTIWALDVH